VEMPPVNPMSFIFFKREKGRKEIIKKYKKNFEEKSVSE
jgi:hypothetical protein